VSEAIYAKQRLLRRYAPRNDRKVKMFLEAKNLKKTFKHAKVNAVADVSFSLKKGETLGVVGESGSGKTTLAKLILRLLPLDAGEIYFEGHAIGRLKENELKSFRKRVQVVFQEPTQALDPRMRVSDILKESFWIQGQRDKNFLEGKVAELLRAVELPLTFASRYPHQLSGGECQRIAIARAISTDPELIVCDEPVSSLDVLVQIQILNLLLKLQKEKGVSYIFISHDLKVVRHMSDELLTLKDGRAISQIRLQI